MPTDDRAAGADGVLRGVREPLLEVRVARADDRDVGMRARELGGRRDHPRRADQRVLGRRVAVGRREERRPLDVRVVVRAAGGDAHEPDAELAAQVEEPVRLGEVEAETGRVGAERVAGQRGRVGDR